MEKEIRIIPTDTAESIFFRAAAMLNSIPNYLYMKNVPIVEGRPEGRTGQQSVIDVQKIITRDKLVTEIVDLFNIIRNEGDINKFAAFLSKNLRFFPTLSLEDAIIKPWLYYHISEIDDDTDLMVFSYLSILNTALKLEPKIVMDINIHQFQVDKEITLEGFNNKMKTIKQRNTENLASYKEVVSVPYTDFELDKFKYALTISDNYTFTLQDIFDSVVLSEEFPFSHLYINDENYYKIYKDFIPYSEWSMPPESGSQIILKFLTDKTEKINDTKKAIYDDIRVILDSGKCVVLLDVELDKYKKDTLFKKVLHVFQRELDVIIKAEPVIIKGVFYIPKQSVNTYIFSHLVMNDINFSKIVINEGDKPTKGTSGINILYRTKDTELSETTSLILTSKLVDRFDVKMRDKSESDFPENEPYVRIRVTAKNEEVIQDIQKNMGRIIALYNDKYKSVFTLYRKYIPTFSDEKLVPKQLGKKSTMVGDKRHCIYRPIIIRPEDAGNYTDTMVFPLPGDPSDKSPGITYACEISKDKKKSKLQYVGLQMRKEGNFVPCCYQQNQKEKSGSDYNKYLTYVKTGEKMKKNIGKKQQRVISTKKILDYTDVSDNLIYDTVNQFFELTDPGVDHFRGGTFRSNMSMIGSLLEVVRKEGEVIVEETLTKTKRTMANNLSLVSLCKQALPNKSIDEIREYMLRDDTYINPRIFTDMLEEYFGCRIYTFDAFGLVKPNYKKNYLRYKDSIVRDKTVILIEHIGSEADHSVVPQCEFVSFSNSKNVFEYFYKQESTVAKTLDGIINRMTRSYFLNNEVVPFNTLPFEPSGQKFDNFGKVCAFTFKLNGVENYIAYTTRPYPPLPIKELDIESVVFSNLEVLQKAFKGKVKDGLFYIHHHDFIIPINQDYKLALPQVQKSVIKEFNRYSKFAKYITEYFIYAYSWYIFDNKLQVGEESVSSFSTRNVQIIKKYKSVDMNKIFSRNSIIYNNNIMYVTSEEIVKRCIYALRLESARDPLKIANYKNRQNIFAFIENVSDYKTYPTQTIIFGKDTLQKYISELFASNEINYNIGFSGENPVYYKFEDNIYLSQNILPMQKDIQRTIWEEKPKEVAIDPKEGYPKAINVCNNWKTHKVNVDKFIGAAEFSLFNYYREGTDFKTESFVPVNEIDTEQKILTYKIKGIQRYTSLLNLNIL